MKVHVYRTGDKYYSFRETGGIERVLLKSVEVIFSVEHDDPMQASNMARTEALSRGLINIDGLLKDGQQVNALNR